MRTCMCVCVRACVCAYVGLCVYEYMCAYVCVGVRACVCVCVRAEEGVGMIRLGIPARFLWQRGMPGMSSTCT